MQKREIKKLKVVESFRLLVKMTSLLLLVLVFAFGININTASALTISPARAEFTTDPGTQVDGSITLINDQSEAKTFYATVERFESQGETGTPAFIKTEEGLPAWVSVPKVVELKAGETKVVQFSIKVPKEAEAGGHFAALFWSTNPPVEKSTQVVVGAKVGMLMFLRVAGDIKDRGGIVSFSTENDKSFYTSLPVNFIYRFNNEGNDRVQPRGSLVIKNTIGITSTKIDANAVIGNVLPQSIRKFNVAWGDNLIPKGFFDTAWYQAKNFAFGYYSANLNLTYGASDQKTSAKVGLFVLPWQLLLLVIVGLLIIWLILRTALRIYKAHILSQVEALNEEFQRHHDAGASQKSISVKRGSDQDLDSAEGVGQISEKEVSSRNLKVSSKRRSQRRG